MPFFLLFIDIGIGQLPYNFVTSALADYAIKPTTKLYGTIQCVLLNWTTLKYEHLNQTLLFYSLKLIFTYAFSPENKCFSLRFLLYLSIILCYASFF